MRRVAVSLAAFASKEVRIGMVSTYWEMIPVHGLVEFVPAVDYHFCLKLPATF